MKLKPTNLAAAITAAFALSVSGQAAADLYAGSSLNLDQLSIGIGEVIDGQFVPAFNNVKINTFNFTLTNTAALNGVLSGTTATCNGTPASNNCGTGISAPDTLYANPANAVGGDLTRTAKGYSGADNTFTWFGIGAGTNWSNSDSIIHTSELTNGTPTHTDQIAEAKISSANNASSSAQIQSTTGFTFTFTVDGPNPVALDLSFLADPDMFAQIMNEGLNGYSNYAASADMAVTFTLSKDGVFGVGAGWAPNGEVDQNCQGGGGVSCLEISDTESLNGNVGTTSDNTNDQYSYGPNIPGLVGYHSFISGLSQGNWTLVLKATTSTQLTHVPEPGALALMGIGLLGLGMSTYRRKKSS
jgi:hypothetical protein